MNQGLVSRRELLAGAGMALTGALWPVRSTAAAGAAWAQTGADTAVLQAHGHRLPAEVHRQLAACGARFIALEEDPVRQWRGAAAALLAARSTRLVGATRWPEFLLVRGLAEESGRRVRYQQRDCASGAILWLIA